MKQYEAVKVIVPCEVLFIQMVYIIHVLGGSDMDLLGALVAVATVTFVAMVVLSRPTKVKKKKAKVKAKTKRKTK